MANKSGLPQNKYFCIRPFTQLSTFNDKKFRLCCSAKVDSSLLNSEYSNQKTIWNSQVLKKVRKKLLDGKPIPECESCYSLDMVGGQSDRKMANKSLSDFEFDSFQSGIVTEELAVSPVVLDIRVGNICNLRCQSCYPSLSHLVNNDVKTIFGDNRAELSSIAGEKSLSSGIELKDIKELLPGVRKIKIIGGEPMLNDFTHELIDFLIESDISKNIEFCIHTNLMKWDSIFIEKLKVFKKTRLCMSIDAVGPLNDYIRYPSEWSLIHQNLRKYISVYGALKNIDLAISPVVQVFNIFHIDELIKYVIELEELFGVFLNLDFIFLTDPSYYSAFILPKQIKEEARDRFKSFFLDLDGVAKIRFKEISTFFENLVNSDHNPKQCKVFWNITNAYDRHRKMNIGNYLSWTNSFL